MTSLLLIIPELFGISIEVYVIILLFGIGIFYFWRWIFKRAIPSNKKKRVLVTWISTVLSAPILYVLFIAIWAITAFYYPSRDFDKQKWSYDVDTRYEFSESIVDSELLIGKSKNEVQEILGKPDGWVEESFWEYVLGYKPGIMGSIDPTLLIITFENDKVIKVVERES